MTNGVKFSEDHLKRAEELLAGGKVQSIIFSGGTYQIEVKDGESYWIFLQIDDEGKILDCFCSCAAAEKDKTCAHLAAGMSALFGKEREPLHVRFQTSLWNHLFQMLAKRYGYDTSILEKKEDSYLVAKETKEPRFLLQIKSESARDKMIELIDQRKEETEETSLKFSNLELEEIEKWREGNPSESLAYELSFWSDLAKWIFLLEDQEEEVVIAFDDKEGELPKKANIALRGFTIEVPIYQNDWPFLIPSLASYDTNLKVYDFADVIIENILYDKEKREFKIHAKAIDAEVKKAKTIEWTNWIFRKGFGFFSKKQEPLLAKNVIPEEQISYFLQRYARLMEKYLVGDTITKKPKKAKYELFFDETASLHIRTYLFEPQDLVSGSSCFFDPWAYIEGKGFFRLYQTLFKGIEKVIPQEHVSEFVDKNRHWLNKFEEFRIHLSNIEAKLSYEMVDDTLKIKSDETLFDQESELLDFGSWIYVKGQGFFSRGKTPGQRVVAFPKEVHKEEISSFIHQRKEDLEQVKGFFVPDSGIEKSGLVIQLNEKGQLTIEPKFTFRLYIEEQNPRVYGDFIYIPQKGFAEVPDSRKIPSSYWRKTIIERDQIPYFIKHELKRLKPYILDLDKHIVEPSRLKLVVKHAVRQDKGWLIQFSFVSSLGEVSLLDVRSALLRFHPFILSEAGMIHLKDKRFAWITRLSSSLVEEETGSVQLSTLDWIRLSLFDEVVLPEVSDPEEKKVIDTLAHLQGSHIAELPKLKGLESILRPYQEIGVRWLWFLYTYGLSGFLCDEMGLGKTHQAMALIAAVMNEKKKSQRSKFLVVCPTSVIYHWQGLLQKFLKKADVLVYHGPFRVEKELKVRHDIVVTTYGVLRSDKELFKKMHFEVAIFDEMQVAKNQKSQIHSTLKEISAEMKLALTGTPIENSLLELKALFDIVLPNFLPTQQEYKEEFVIPIEKYGDIDKQKALSTLVKPFILRRKKQEVLSDLPEKIEEITYIDMSDEQRRLYESVVNGSKEIINEEGNAFYMHVFALLNKLKQVCNHPALVHDDPQNFERYESGKWDCFVELLEETLASGQKLVVFSQYLTMLDIIENYLRKQNIGFAGIRGSTTNRQQEMQKFQEEKECQVFVGSLQAAGVGIDLTAASTVIHYDRWWNPAKENQATDRVHRIGQNRGVSVFKLVIKNSVEEHINDLIEKKTHLVKNIIGYDSENELKKLDRSELERLLKKIYADIE